MYPRAYQGQELVVIGQFDARPRVDPLTGAGAVLRGMDIQVRMTPDFVPPGPGH